MAGELAAHLVEKLASYCTAEKNHKSTIDVMQKFEQEYPFIQFIQLVDTKGDLLEAITNPEEQANYGDLIKEGYNYSDRNWFKMPLKNGKVYISDVAQSVYTKKLIITVSHAIVNDKDEITGVIGADIQLEEIIKRAPDLEAEENEIYF